MRAAAFVRADALEAGIVPARIRVILRGSLAATGRGHGTDRAVLAGLLGWDPATCDVDALLALPDHLASSEGIAWGASRVRLHPDDVVFQPFLGEPLPHPNTLDFELLDARRHAAPRRDVVFGGGRVHPRCRGATRRRPGVG